MTAWSPAQFRDALDTDDAFNEGRRRDNGPAAAELAARSTSGWLTVEAGAELPWPCRHMDDPAAPDCPTYESHCCSDDPPCRHFEEDR